MSEAQKELLRQAQIRYINQDPRWGAHRKKLSEAQKRPEQRQALSAAQLSYMASDPRWPDHEARMRQAALEVTKINLFPEELDEIQRLRSKGRTFEYIGEHLCVADKIIRRELKAIGISTKRVQPDRRAKRTKGHWRCFDEV